MWTERRSGMRQSWRTASVGSGRASWEMFSMFDFIPEATQSQEKTLCSGLHFMRIRPADRWKADWRGGRVRQEAAWEAVASIRVTGEALEQHHRRRREDGGVEGFGR